MNEFERRFEGIFGKGSLGFDLFSRKNEPVCQFREVWHNHTCKEGFTYWEAVVI